MDSVLENITQTSKKGYIDSAEEAGKILDNVMKYTLRELGLKNNKGFGNETFLALIQLLYEYKTEKIYDENELLSDMCIPDKAMEKSMNRLPWTKLFSAVTLNALFGAYAQRSTQGINYNKRLAKIKRMIKRCTDFETDDTTTVGTVLKKVRSARRRSWFPDEDVNQYAYAISGCYRIIKMILFDGPVDIYDIRTLCKNPVHDADSSVEFYEIA